MSGARVCGNSAQARGLKNIMSQTIQHIENCTESMERAANTVHSAWNDKGVGEVDEILISIRTALNGAKDAMPKIESALEAYADFLDEQ